MENSLEQERRGLHQVRAQVRGALDLGADPEHDLLRPGRVNPWPQQVDRAQQRVGSTLFGESSSPAVFPLRASLLGLGSLRFAHRKSSRAVAASGAMNTGS